MTYFSTLLYYLEVPTGLEPVNNGFAIRRLTSLAKEPKSKEVMAVEGYKSSIYSTRTPYSSVAPLAPSIDYRGATLSLGKRRYSARLPFSPWPSL